MILQILILLAGLVLIVGGAEFLVNGASSIARKAGISEFIIGLTIVGMGTSAPEMVVSFVGAFSGNADIAVGNVLGSNIFNTLLILGISTMICPMLITRSNKRVDIPANMLFTLLLLALGLKYTLAGIGSDTLTRVDGGLLLLLFIAYMGWSFVKGKDSGTSDETPEKTYPLLLAIIMVLGGLAALVVGGNLFVDSATEIAKALGVSDKFIAVTILAGGTSLPELATCIVAAAKKKGQLALGNIIGSNIFNLLLILGGSALIHPLSFADIDFLDAGILALSALLLLLACYTGKRNTLDRFEGAIMFLCGIAYYTLLIAGL